MLTNFNIKIKEFFIIRLYRREKFNIFLSLPMIKLVSTISFAENNLTANVSCYRKRTYTHINNLRNEVMWRSTHANRVEVIISRTRDSHGTKKNPKLSLVINVKRKIVSQSAQSIKSDRDTDNESSRSSPDIPDTIRLFRSRKRTIRANSPVFLSYGASREATKKITRKVSSPRRRGN